ncbi:choline/ethanolamine kinase family protein [Roseibium sp.]|uniref:choline/ethanolamine kinase family protein n=1 Tax=Roseibium sp. TaxID=1936156 RepID=UPI003D0B38BB
MQLQAGLTNRVYRLEAERGTFFLRLPGAETQERVDRAVEAGNIEVAAALDLALPPVFCRQDTGILVTRAVEVIDGRPPDFPTELGTLIGRLHGSNTRFSGSLDLPAIVQSYRQLLSSKPDFAAELAALDGLLDTLIAQEELLSSQLLVPSHCDLSPGNCLSTPDGVRLIDWEFSAMADPAWDLAYAILEHGFSQDQEDAFLEAYRFGRPSCDCPSRRHLDFMKAGCDAVSALWAFEQVMRGRDRNAFIPFARERRERALTRLRPE